MDTPSKSTAMKVLFVASECTPYAKAGGLGDVVGALPKALRRMHVDARILLPLYRGIDREAHGLVPDNPVCTHLGQGEIWSGTWQGILDGEVPVWFLDHEHYFGRPGIYDEPWGEYADNPLRFALLSKAALQLCKDKGFIPDVIHTHDWPTALSCAYLKTWDRILSPLAQTAGVLTIHNIGYQGKYGPAAFPHLGLGWEHFTPNEFEDHGGINLLKGGLVFADAITAVSPTYAREILGPIGGAGLDSLLRQRQADLVGILNGVDYEHWDPAIDPLIPARFSAANMTGKQICKIALQKRMGLSTDPGVVLFGVVSRMVTQKGFGLLKEILPRALGNMHFQLAVLGSGDAGTEQFFRDLAMAFPGKVAAHIGFSNELSHWIEAGSDVFLMPSLYEPCGLNQIYSLKYGTIPLVRATGGLDDTVENYNQDTGRGTGFKFWDPTAQALYDTIGWAVATWYDRPHHIEQLRQQGMAQHFPWSTAATQYVDVYRRAMGHRRRSV